MGKQPPQRDPGVEGVEEGSSSRFRGKTVDLSTNSDDIARTEATFRFKVDTFSKIKESTLADDENDDGYPHNLSDTCVIG